MKILNLGLGLLFYIMYRQELLAGSPDHHVIPWFVISMIILLISIGEFVAASLSWLRKAKEDR